jgi:hypothetical protein
MTGTTAGSAKSQKAADFRRLSSRRLKVATMGNMTNEAIASGPKKVTRINKTISEVVSQVLIGNS